MDEFRITYTRNLIFQWLKESLTVTQWDITIESDNSLVFFRAGSNTTTVPVEGLKKVELKSKYSLLTFLGAAFVVFTGLYGMFSTGQILTGMLFIFCGVVWFFKGIKNELTFYLKENILSSAVYRISVPFFEKEKLQDAQKVIRSVMAYETEKRDFTKHTQTMADAVTKVADAISGSPQMRTAIPVQKQSAQRTVTQRQSTQRIPQKQSTTARKTTSQAASPGAKRTAVTTTKK